jgi:hypothetical protein
MPDIHLGSLDRFAILIARPSFEKERRPWRRGSQEGTAVFSSRGFSSPKRTEQIRGAFGRRIVAIIKETDER